MPMSSWWENISSFWIHVLKPLSLMVGLTRFWLRQPTTQIPFNFNQVKTEKKSHIPKWYFFGILQTSRVNASCKYKNYHFVFYETLFVKDPSIKHFTSLCNKYIESIKISNENYTKLWWNGKYTNFRFPRTNIRHLKVYQWLILEPFRAWIWLIQNRSLGW